MALIFITMMSLLSMSMVNSSMMDLTKTTNHQERINARMAAESGLKMSLYWLRDLRIPGTTTQSSFAANMTAALGDRINYTFTLGRRSVFVEEGTVTVPAVNLLTGSFQTRLSYVSADLARLQVKGMYQDSVSYISMDLSMEKRRPMVFDYGLASMGQISIGGSSKIVGLNDYLPEI